ncbi:MAG TPA: hypothetical protein VKI00_08225 [Mycobacterium sp.]|uniref:hypothetical protein n=1 Tax=Mycobacterium sp. TaxID=1785 RepID=UPI002BC1FFE5|nr:hypothetical protein [Mycobacterium sp.]HME75630.1 hypothetical protein [Mycobacterium sp.]
MTVKMLATGAAAVAAIGAAAAGVTSFASGSTSALGVQPVALGVPFAQDPPPPAPGLPTAGDLSSLCTNLTNPGVNYHSKTGLVAGGINDNDGRVADHDLREAFRDGKFPQSYDVTNIQPAGPNAATADVAISGPKFPTPVTRNLTFVNQGGWTIAPDSAQALVQAATS